MSEELRSDHEADEQFLDDAYQRLLASVEKGESLSVDELIGPREHLREQVRELLETACDLARPSTTALPQVNGFTLVRELGRGGMGIVFLALQESLGGRQVALKLLPPATRLSARARERFLTEARAIARIRHSNVVTIHDIVLDDAVCAYSMEFVDGPSLERLIERLAARSRDSGREPTGRDVDAILGTTAIPPADSYPIRVARWGVAIARALGELHRAGFVHRDVKPSNILLRRDGAPLLSDFGLIHTADHRITHSGQFLGTVTHASPEQLAGEADRLDARSDVYSLGITLYHALALHLPFDDLSANSARKLTPTGMLRLIESGRVKPLRAWNSRLPRDLETILAKATDLEPRRRYVDAAEFADDLQRLLDLQPIHARPAGLVTRGTKFLRRNRAAAVGVLAGSVATLGLLAGPAGYAVVAAREVDESVRAAQLALLDPSNSGATVLGSYWSLPHVHDTSTSPSSLVLGVHERGLDEAIKHLRSASRWRLGDARVSEQLQLLECARRGEPARLFDDPELAAMQAFVTGDVSAALAAWERYEARRDSNQPRERFVDAASGILLLGRKRVDLAYERLARACLGYPDVGFLWVYLAQAALESGQVDTARDRLARAAGMQRHDSIRTFERVQAQLWAYDGELARAEAVLRDIPGARAAHSLGVILQANGRVVEASECFRRALNDAPEMLEARAAFETAMKARWSGMSSDDRFRATHEALAAQGSGERSFVDLLGAYRQCETAPSVFSGLDLRVRPISPTELRALLREFAALPACVANPYFQSVELDTLTRTLEVLEMLRTKLSSAPPHSLVDFKLAAWLAQSPAVLSRLAASTQRGVLPLAIGALALDSMAQSPSFHGMGDLPGGANSSDARGVSDDGFTVVGRSTSSNGVEAVSWRNGALQALPNLSIGAADAIAWDANFDGSVVVGGSKSPTSTWRQPVSWSAAGVVALPPAGSLTGQGDAAFVSPDGRVIAGTRAQNLSDAFIGFVATDGVVSTYSDPSGPNAASGLSRMSPDGRYKAGFVADGAADYRAAVWIDEVLLELPELGSGHSQAVGVSDDGNVLVGVSRSNSASAGEPTRWVRNGASYTAHGLGSVLGAPNANGVAFSCTSDGRVIVGWTTTHQGKRAFVWDAQHGMRLLSDVLTLDYGLNLNGWTLEEAFAVTPDGSVIVGRGIHGSDTEGWIARLAPTGHWSYCTSATTTNGCTPTLGATGLARVGAADGFSLVTTQVEGQRSGLYFYGFAPTATPWHVSSSSWLCVVPPLIRTSTQSSGGSAGACDGAFSLDWSAWLAANPTALGAPYSVGQALHAQAWFRDPPAPRSTNLSNAVSWTMRP